MKVKTLSHVRLLETPWTVAYQAPPSMGFSRQEYWSGVPLPSPEIIANHAFSHLPSTLCHICLPPFAPIYPLYVNNEMITAYVNVCGGAAQACVLLGGSHTRSSLTELYFVLINYKERFGFLPLSTPSPNTVLMWRKNQIASSGAHGGQRGGGHRLGLATAACARGVPLSPAGPHWSGRHSVGVGALSSPALTGCMNFFGSRSQGAARRVRGTAGGTEVRAGWGAASERVYAPRTWCLGDSDMTN